MLLSLDWLKDFVKLPKSVTPEELAERLSLHTVEVESVENQAKKYDKVVVGKILKVEKHPNADRLRLAQVNVGAKVLSIVCGAPNIQEGQTVPVALVGAELPNGAVIQEAEVRGVRSQGMLCAPDELGLGDDHGGILLLDKKAKAGDALAEFLGLDQVVLEVDNKSLSNRPDLWSHQGMAREIAAIYNAKYTPLPVPKRSVFKSEAKSKLEISVEDFTLCKRYLAVTMEGIKIGPSPDWLAKRLVAVGARPINNIVDITNYVMFELGQPLHAFDRALVDKIIVRPAKEGETIETLDGEKRVLDKERLVIADGKKPIAIAGVMGGAASEISAGTDAIILEAANFDFASVRRTSQKLALRTESSMRFEKGLDSDLAEAGIARAVELIKKVCPQARVSGELIDQKSVRSEARRIDLNLAWLNHFLGFQIKASQVGEILTSLGFGVKEKDDALSVTVPSWRATRDIEAPEDLAEEVARIYGYDNIASNLPQVRMAPPETGREGQLVRKIKAILAGGAAMTEVYNYSFVGEDQLKKLFIDPKNHLTLLNPLASNQTLLRQSLAPNLLENIKTNQSRYSEIALFEIGTVFFSSEGEEMKDNSGSHRLPYQEKRLALALANDKKSDLLRQLKGVVEFLLGELGLSVVWLGSKIAPTWAEDQSSAEIIVAGKMLGTVNLLAAKIGKGSGLKKRVALAEVSLPQLLLAVNQSPARQFEEFEKYPPLTRDLAFVVDSKILFSDLKQEIAGFNQLIRRAEFFDVFQGGKLGEKNKSLAFHIVYQASDRTLTSEEADNLQKSLVKRLEEKFGAKVRDF